MVFAIASELFQKEESFQDLDLLLQMVEEDCHYWSITEEIQLQEIMDSKWAETMRDQKRNFLITLIEKTYQSGFYRKRTPKIIIQEFSEQGTSKYSLDEAKFYLQESVQILLENSLYDSYFLNSLFKCFEKQSTKINVAFKMMWIRYSNAGGKNNIVNYIKGEFRRFERAGFNPQRLLRLIVVLDSDRLNPIQGAQKGDVEQFCIQYNIPLHILYKREMENYLPDDVFNNMPGHLNLVSQAYLELDENQKDFYDLEKGFGAHSKKESIDPIFASINEEQYKKLKTGFDGPGFRTKQELPKLFDLACVDQKSLKLRCLHQPQPNELENLIEKVSCLL